MNVVMVPMWVCSGVFFSSTQLPGRGAAVIQALPLTAVIDALRANMLQGGGFQAVAGEWRHRGRPGWCCRFAVALRFFRWR